MIKYLNRSYAQIFILLLVFTVLYYQTLMKLINDWSNNPDFSHGFLIPFISAYLIWQKKEKLAGLSLESDKLGLPIIVFGMFLHFIGNIGAELFTMRFSMVVTLLGISHYLFGRRIGREVRIPVLYLLFMIPIPMIIWNKIAFPLKLYASKLSAAVIEAIGISVYREGNILNLSNTTLEVVDACSGIRSLTTLLAISGALAYVVRLRNFNKWILFVSAVPVAIIVNVIRLVITAILAKTSGPEAAQGFLHDLSGILVIFVAIFMLLVIYSALSVIEKKISAPK